MGWLLGGLGLLRTLFFTLPLIYLVTLLLGLVAQVMLLFDRDAWRQHRLAQMWARALLGVSLVRVRVRGRDNLEPRRHYVYVANHQSYFDVLALLVGLETGVRFMAKASLFPIPFVGWYLRRTGHLPIEMSEGSVQANARQLLLAVRRIRQGSSLVVFPEGGRSDSETMGEFKPGIFLAALKAGAWVVPVSIRGTRAVLAPRSWTIHPGRVELILSPPVPTEELGKDHLNALMARVRKEIERSLQEAQA